MWKGLEEFTKYTKSQRRAIYIILGFIVVMQVILYFLDDIFPAEDVEITLSPEVVAYFEDKPEKAQSDISAELFAFNPNTASADDLKKLGMPPSSVERLINYRNKGGAFRKPADLYKLYGVDSSWVEVVIDYVVLPETERTPKDFSQKTKLNLSPFDPNSISINTLEEMGFQSWQAKRIVNYREKVKHYKSKEDLYKLYGFDSAFVQKLLPYIAIEESTVVSEEIVPLEINTADSLALIEVSGIGAYTAKNILKYREMLGGFVSVNQLSEVYGIKPQQLEQIIPYLNVDASKIQKLNINTATFKELLRHPYLKYEIVKSITNFRENTRLFKSVGEIQYLEGMDEQIFEEARFYLKVSD